MVKSGVALYVKFAFTFPAVVLDHEVCKLLRKRARPVGQRRQMHRDLDDALHPRPRHFIKPRRIVRPHRTEAQVAHDADNFHRRAELVGAPAETPPDAPGTAPGTNLPANSGTTNYSEETCVPDNPNNAKMMAEPARRT